MDAVDTIENLRIGIEVWKEKKWPDDFHSSLYSDLSRWSGIDLKFWDRVLNELARWGALRGVSKEVIRLRGIQVLPDLQREYTRILHSHNDKKPDLNDVKWQELESLFSITHSIKGANSPVFASKMCHFLLPDCFIVIDNAVIGVNEIYPVYWFRGQYAWSKCEDKELLKKELQNYARVSLPSIFPWSTKITELCLIGSKLTSVSKLQVQKGQRTITGSRNETINLGDVLISHKKGYHHVVESINGNKATILWLERVSGEPIPFIIYRREIKFDRAAVDYDVVRAADVDRSQYHTPRNGWPNG